MASPIEDYALLGDAETAALVSKDGSVDWLALPRFDSPACFTALLGDEGNGRWQIRPASPIRLPRPLIAPSGRSGGLMGYLPGPGDGGGPATAWGRLRTVAPGPAAPVERTEMDAPSGTTPGDELERQLRHASFFVQASLEQHGRLTGKLDVYLSSVIELLLARGVLEAEELATAVDANRAEHAAEARARFETDGTLPAWPTVMVREDDPDQPDVPEVEVDCAARMPICQAVCCSLPFPLSAAEVEAGDVKWDLGHPYVIRQTTEGYCVHNERSGGGCEVYDKRPGVCRGYSCAQDERIWTDFDNMVLNHEYLDNRRRADFKFRPSTGDAVAVTIRPPRRRDPAAVGATP